MANINPSSALRKLSIWAPLILASAVAIGVLIGHKFNPNYTNYFQVLDIEEDRNTGEIGRIEEIIRFVENSYVDSINNESLVEEVINNLLSQLDPFSSYISADDLSQYNEQLDGVFKGIGINYVKWQDSVFIIKVIDGSDADEKGLKRGDAILSIDGNTVSGADLPIDEVRSIIKNDEDQELPIEVLTPGHSDPVTKLVEVKELPINTANVAYKLSENLVYSKIERFSANTYKQFVQSLEALKIEDQQVNMILDLRDNPGGYLPETIKILSQFFKEKQQLLTYTEGNNRKRKEYKSTGQQFFDIDKIALLINGYSASGSEIIAGALQDWDQAVIIGNTSYGKGLVQEIYQLKNGGALRLTVARYMTPAGRSIQKPYSLQDSTRVITQEGSAYNSLRYNRPLTGGGGIDPDIEMEDVDRYGDCYNFEFKNFNAFLLKHLELKSPYADFEDFQLNFKMDQLDFEKYLGFAGIDNEEEKISEDCIGAFTYLCKLNMAAFWYDDEASSRVDIAEDAMIIKAQEVLQERTLQALLSYEK